MTDTPATITITVPAVIAYKASNGTLFTLDLATTPDPGLMVYQLADHGLGQKIGDVWSGKDDGPDKDAARAKVLAAVQAGKWSARTTDEVLIELRRIATAARWVEGKVAAKWKNLAAAEAALGSAKFKGGLKVAGDVIALRDAAKAIADEPEIADAPAA